MRRPLCLFAALFLCSLYAYYLITGAINADRFGQNLPENGTKVYVYGKVRMLSVKGEQEVAELTECSFLSAGDEVQETDGGLLVYPDETETEEPKIGERVLIEGTFYAFERAENEGQFDAASYYAVKGLCGRLFDARLMARGGTHSRLSQTLHKVRRRIEAVYETYLSPEDAGLLAAIVLGEKGMVDTDVKQRFQNAGYSHLLALSGLHVAAVGLGILYLIKRLVRKIFAHTTLRHEEGRGGKKATLVSAVLSGGILFLYCLMTGMSVSTMRAFFMLLLAIIADMTDRTYDLLSAAAVSSVIVSLIRPASIYDVGFRLSFLAVLSIAVIYPRLVALLPEKAMKKPVEALLVSLSIQLGTLPVVAESFYQIPLLGIVLNLIAIPLMSVVLPCGIVLGIAGGIGSGAGIGVVFEKIAQLCGFITHAIFWVYNRTATLSTVTNAGVLIVGKPVKWRVAAYYALLFTALFAARYLAERREKETSEVGVSLYVDQRSRPFMGLKHRFYRPVGTLILCGILMIAAVILCTNRPGGFSVRNLSVGQGDCSLIISDTHVILIDCGSTTESGVGTYRLIPNLKANGIGKIDVVFVSHFDLDHVSGIVELLSDPVYRTRIGGVILSSKASETDGETEAYRQLLELCSLAKIPVYGMRRGDRLAFGSMIVTCLSPDADTAYPDTNAASAVLHIYEEESGFSGLFTGDIGEETETGLLSDDLSINYLKVAHHGSNGSSSASFLQHFLGEDPERVTAVISVGEGNRYGHPGGEMLRRIRSFRNVDLYRTDEQGEVITEYDRSGAKIRTFF